MMARTKKQTLENASERKRQIQEEILRESLALKRDNPSGAQEVSLPKGNTVAVSSSSAAGCGKSKTCSSKAAGGYSVNGDSSSYKYGVRRDHHRYISSQVTLSSMSALARTSRAQSVELPKAVICIPDICKSPPKNMDEDASSRNSRESTPKRYGGASFVAGDGKDIRGSGKSGQDSSSRSKHYSNKNIFEQVQTEMSSKLKESCQKQSDHLRSAVNVSLNALKAASEQGRPDKVKKSRPATVSNSPDTLDNSKCKRPSPKSTPVGRRSPRQHSPGSRKDQQASPGSKLHKDMAADAVSEERPKVNIFTDNIGVDLGKRIRSPRRMSEDMIALPIFSARRWSNLPKDNNSVVPAGKNDSSGDGHDSYLKPVVSDSCFKSPSASPSSSRRSSSSTSPHKTLSPTAGSSGSDGAVVSSVNLRPPQGNQGASQPSQKKGNGEEDKVAEKKSKSYPLRKSKLGGVSQEIEPSEEGMVSLPSSMQKSNCIAEKTVECASDSERTSVQVKGSQSKGEKAKPHKKSKHKSEKHAEMEEVMSSICKEIIKEVVISKPDSDNEIEKMVKTEPADMERNDSSGEIVIVLPVCSREINSGSLALAKESLSNVAKVSQDHMSSAEPLPSEGKANENLTAASAEEKPSSLLCAMLVGGTEVAHTYTQEREKYKPHIPDVSDSEGNSSKGERDEIEEVPVSSGATTAIETPADCVNIKRECDDNQPGCSTSSVSFQQSVLNEEHSDCTAPFLDIKKDVKKESTNNVSGIVKGENGSGRLKSLGKRFLNRQKNLKIDFSSKLGELNESVLQLIDIDTEEEFVHNKWEVKASSDANEDTSAAEATKLYGLIQNLVTKLKDSAFPCNIPIDSDAIDKLVESCPKNALSAVVKFDENSRQDKLQKRLEEEAVKLKSVCSGKKNMEMDVEDGLNDSKQEAPVAVDKNVLNDRTGCEVSGHTDFGASQSSSTRNVFCGDKSFSGDSEGLRKDKNCAMAASSSSLDGSLCELDLDAITSAATSVICASDTGGCGEASRASSDIDCSELSNLGVKVPINDMQTSSLSGLSQDSVLRKSKTCDEFSGGGLRHHAALRRVNSSPQMNSRLAAAAVSAALSMPNLNNSPVKSKLGSKIPIPGASHVSRSSKRTWRTPRVIKDPTPLSVLSDLEATSDSRNIFVCQNLQKYLNTPSHRMIVPLVRKEEMEILDAKAKEEEERLEREMAESLEKGKQDKDEEARKMEEEINADYSKFEPDFDEVDGMLFMSFSSEVELEAHVRVERALDWDKNDTMLRISRAKAFEEAKLQNQDMQGVKLKHLRGQHMRWKKYRRLYSCEVKNLLDAKERGVPCKPIQHSRKTSDITKIKGWKKKQTSDISHFDSKENFIDLLTDYPQEEADQSLSTSFENDYGYPYYTSEGQMDEDLQFLGETTAEGDGTNDISPYMRRCKNFSHQKAHKQLFRELNMDWEDRMIHRKLGGWSLKGNRPKAFSQAAKKRQEKEARLTVDAANLDSVKDPAMDLSLSAALGDWNTDGSSADAAGDSPSGKKKKQIKMIYPLLSERMARNALRTLETGDIFNTRRKKKRRQLTPTTLPALTPIPAPRTPIVPSTSSQDHTPLDDTASTIGSTLAGSDLLSTPSQQPVITSQSKTPLTSSSASTATTPLQLDVKEEMVLEGVDVSAVPLSSPALSETPSSTPGRSCGKLGCRYGCICHLCSATEDSPVQAASPVSKPAARDCDKEYCRLGCICDSIDPEKPIPTQTHCRKASCMLRCVCQDSGVQEGNDDIPYLPSMKRRPKPGERFSNLPQREKTHRSAKNLDAITRKAMMLYETSEIYCEKVERTKKKTETASSSPNSSPLVSPAMSSAPAPSTAPINLPPPVVYTEIDDSDYLQDDSQTNTIFSAVNLLTSQETSVAASQVVVNSAPIVASVSSGAPLVPFSRPIKMALKIPKPTFVVDDVLQSAPVIEPSAHKRKRKSHPLSSEIFTNSTCARVHPYKYHMAVMEKSGRRHSEAPLTRDLNGSQSATSSLLSLAGSGIKISTSAEIGMMKTDVKAGVNSGSGRPQSECSQPVNTNPCQKASDVSSSLPTQTALTPGPVSAANVAVSQNMEQNQAQQSHPMPPQRQFHGWHTSMVCLKARAPAKTQSSGEEDVQEEDEVKLLEFAANCNWEGAKKEILSKVAQCLSRGHYPQPRTMNVCEFVVEILPKAHHPSIIPAELRVKLPGQMFSIRVRITRRDSISKSVKAPSVPVIDLSDNSPLKVTARAHSADSNSHSLSIKTSSNFLSSPSRDGPSSLPSSTPSLGISGLSQLCVDSTLTRQQQQQQLNLSSEGHVHTSPDLHKSSSAPNSRRSSLESFPVDTSIKSCKEEGANLQKGSIKTPKAADSVDLTIQGSTFVKVEGCSSVTSPSTTGSLSSENLVVTSTNKSVPSSKAATTVIPLASSLNVPNNMTPFIGPFSSKNIKYMKFPGNDTVMQVLEIKDKASKNKLIALPMALPNNVGDSNCVQPTVPVMAVPFSQSSQSQMVPILPSQASSQPLFLKIPMSHSGSNNTSQQILVQPMPCSVADGKTTTAGGQAVQLMPKKSTVASHLPDKVDSDSVVSLDLSVSDANSVQRSPEETIMVFDTTKIKALQQAKRAVQKSLAKDQNIVKDTHRAVDADSSLSSCPCDTNSSVGVSTSVTPSLSGPIVCTGVLPLRSKDCEENKEQESCSRSLDQWTGSDLKHDALSDSHLDPSCNSSKSNQENSRTVEDSDAERMLASSSNSSVAASANWDVIVTDAKKRSDVADHDADLSKPANGELEIVMGPESEGARSGGTKRPALDSELVGPRAKRVRRLGGDSNYQLLPVVDEDSNLSACSIPAPTCSAVPSPQLSTSDRPTSVMSSSALSTGSSDDVLVCMLSSDEEIDVGEDHPEAWYYIAENSARKYRETVERALQNDHVSLCSKPNIPHVVLKTSVNTPERVKNRSALERQRRFRLKLLFDELQNLVYLINGRPPDVLGQMSKAGVLSAAKQVILKLDEAEKRSRLEVSKQQHRKAKLEKKLAESIANLRRQNVSEEQIVLLLKNSVRQKTSAPSTPSVASSVQPSSTSCVEGKLENFLDVVNLVSPSSTDEKLSDRAVENVTPVYEDISEAEDSGAVALVEVKAELERGQSYEDISDPEEVQPKYEDISDPEEDKGQGHS
ncbi:uncharacterized protein LOC101848081 [Aplysia californica]|uniref:Uncharacterized protein LOC101848081 n=1 Tax=Aplysia californica TaxID=6500 RepID=A0ABM1W1V9_APLCA|nr:uncharacterized protein LOC101848081 [Aplysia californica]